MKWWKLALIISAIWIALVIGTGIIHTSVILKDKITQEQDEEISGIYGAVCAGGLIPIWILVNLLRRRKDEKELSKISSGLPIKKSRKYLIFGIIGLIWGAMIIVSGMLNGNPQTGNPEYQAGQTGGVLFGAIFIVSGILAIVKWKKDKAKTKEP